MAAAAATGAGEKRACVTEATTRVRRASRSLLSVPRASEKPPLYVVSRAGLNAIADWTVPLSPNNESKQVEELVFNSTKCDGRRKKKYLGVVEPQCTATEKRARKTTLGPLNAIIDSQREASFDINI